MVKLQIDITINETLANTESIVEVLLNNEVIASLDSRQSSYSNLIILPEAQNSLLIRRKYVKIEEDKRNFFGQTISRFMSMILFFGGCIEWFKCLCECSYEYEVRFCKDYAKMEINCILREEDVYPTIILECNECDWTSCKTLFVSDEELENSYREQKRIFCFSLALMTTLLFFLMIMAIIYTKITTLVFSMGIWLLIISSTFYAWKSFKKQCENFKEKYHNYEL